MPRDKRLYLFLLAIVICLSLWQISDPQLQFSTPVASPPYTLNTVNSTPYVYPTQDLPIGDYSQLIDLRGFNYNIFNNPCNETTPLLLVLVHTSPKNYAKRKTIRETWGQPRENLKVLFMIGKVEDEDVLREVEEENRVHKDFAQGNFIDSYRNMTYKHVMVFKFAIYHCPQAKYVLKTDDDIFVNMPTMLDFLTQDLSPYGARNLLLCTPYVSARVLRSYRSKWRVGFAEYPDKYYPQYCPGWALLYSQDVLFALYAKAQQSKYFWIDDVHITGTIVKELKIRHTSVQPYTLTYNEVSRISSGANTTYRSFLLGTPNMSEENIRKLWSYVLLHQRKSTSPNLRTLDIVFLNFQVGALTDTTPSEAE